jgi:hypothetical protein
MTNSEIFAQLLEKPEYKQKPPGDYVKRIDKLLKENIAKIKSKTYDVIPVYKNFKEETKDIEITNHALNRFVNRLKLVCKEDLSDMTPQKFEELLCLMINSSSRERLHNKAVLKSRREKYDNGNATVYISYGCFRFVICRGKLVTTELKGYYHDLN